MAENVSYLQTHCSTWREPASEWFNNSICQKHFQTIKSQCSWNSNSQKKKKIKAFSSYLLWYTGIHILGDFKSCLKSVLNALDDECYIKSECAACVIWIEEEWGECALSCFPTCV